jgi:hypothetical protein
MNNDKKKNLSMSNFKDAQGNLVDPSSLNDEDKLDFYLAIGMKNIIELLEASVFSDRVFSRMKFNVMQIFHDMRDKLTK